METQQQRKIESSTDLLSPPFQKQKLKIKEKKEKQVQRRGKGRQTPTANPAVPLIKALSPIHSSKPVIFATRRVGTLVRAPAPRFIAG